jgi:sporulation protein YlmC with PRC-barrel domain
MYASRRFVAACTVAGLLAVQSSPVSALPEQAAAPQDSSVFSEKLYDGWRASKLIDSHVFSRDAEYLGHVRNAVVADSGQIVALILESEQMLGKDNYVFRVPWDRFSQPLRPGILIADVKDGRANGFGLFLQPGEPNGRRTDFLVTEVLGDRARLKTGQGYGYVEDVVFSQEGTMLAVLVARDAPAGSGTYAFPYPGESGRWDAGLSYYALPYITQDQANKHGYAVDPAKFALRDS